MTSTGIFILRSVCAIACFHCGPRMRRASPDSSAATNTPVPAAEIQLMVNTAASGLAFGGATGGVRWTWRCSAGISHFGSDAVPASLPPSRLVSNLAPESALFIEVFTVGLPQRAQHAMRIAHGVQACMVWPTLYGYVQSSLGAAPSAAAASRSERSRKRVLGFQMKRRNTAVQMTETTPETTSVVRWRLAELAARYCMIAKLPPATSAAGQTSNACFQVPPSILTKVTTSQNGT